MLESQAQTPPGKPRGILVTGAPRSGTSWIGRMLSHGSDMLYLHEPFNNRFAQETFKEDPFPFWFMYITRENEAPYVDKLSRMIGLPPVPQFHHEHGQTGATSTTPVVKDPIAVFSSDWLANRFGLETVFVVRHPAAFVKSVVELGWNTNPRMLFKQALLMKDHFSEHEAAIKEMINEPDKVSQAAFLWKMIYLVGGIYRKRNPHWLYLRHEDVASDPEEQFRSIYDRLGLGYTEDTEHFIAEHCRSKRAVNPRKHWLIKRDSRSTVTSWKGYFTADQLRRIRETTEPVASQYYRDKEWRPE